MIEDHLPGGLEALNEALNTSQVDTTSDGYFESQPNFFLWQVFGYNYKAVFGNRVDLFITDFWSGNRTFTYLARATTSGKFVGLPAEASALYAPDSWGRSESDRVTISAP